MILMEITKEDLNQFSKNWGWFLTFGILLVILGTLAILYAAFTTILSVVFLGFLLTASGIVQIIDTFQFWRHKKGFMLHFLMSLLYLVLGILFITGPVMGGISLTLLLAIAFIVAGAFRIFNSTTLQLPHWKWGLFNGIITLILGILILAQWPMSGIFIIGIFVGIDLLMLGWVYIMGSLFAKRIGS